MNGKPYSLLLVCGSNDEARQASKVLDEAKLDYDRTTATYSEPRLRYSIGGGKASEVIGLLEIKEVIPYILEEIGKQQAA